MPHRSRPPLSRPPDFHRFWAETVRSLASIPPEIESRPVRHRGGGHLELARLVFRSLGGVRVRGYVLRHTDGHKRPLVVHSHGYGSRYEVEWAWAKAGLNVVGVDIRGFGRSRDALPNPSRWGFMLTGIDAPEHHVLRGAVCDYARAVEVGGHLLGDRISRTVLHGVSFAGGLALMAEAVRPSADLLAVGVPTFGWAEGRQFFVKRGSGSEITAYLHARQEHAEDLMVVLRYFDTTHFADLVACPTLVGVGLRDDVVPAATVYAIANHLRGPHEVMEFPVSHSDSPEEQIWSEFESAWIQLAVGGVPADFGSNRWKRRAQ